MQRSRQGLANLQHRQRDLQLLLLMPAVPTASWDVVIKEQYDTALYMYRQWQRTCAAAANVLRRSTCTAFKLKCFPYPLQMTSISLLLATSGNISNQALEVAATLAGPMLCVATFLTLWSLADYMRGVWPYM